MSQYFKKNKDKKRFIETRFGFGLIGVFPNAFIGIIDCLVQIISLGYYSPRLQFKFMSWIITKILGNRRKK